MEAPIQKAAWKKHLGNGIQVALDFKVLGLIALNIMLLYMGLWDTVMRPNLEQMQSRDKALEEQKKLLRDKEGLQKQYKGLEQQLKNLDTELITISAGNSSKVVSVTEAAEILELAKGNLRDVQILPPLLPPHDKRLNVSLTPTFNGTLDLLKPDEAPTTAGSTPSSPPAPQPAPNQMGVATAPANGQGGNGNPEDHSFINSVPVQVGSVALPVERYDYDLKLSGTYPALMDVLNELVIRKKLIRINKVVINRSPDTEAQPNAKDNPEFPVQLDMIVSLSMLLSPASHAGQP